MTSNSGQNTKRSNNLRILRSRHQQANQGTEGSLKKSPHMEAITFFSPAASGLGLISFKKLRQPCTIKESDLTQELWEIQAPERSLPGACGHAHSVAVSSKAGQSSLKINWHWNYHSKMVTVCFKKTFYFNFWSILVETRFLQFYLQNVQGSKAFRFANEQGNMTNSQRWEEKKYQQMPSKC